jgi:hypothetical protein
VPRYYVTGLPPAAAAGHSAFVPHFNRLAASGAQRYKGQVSGQPGTMGIPIATQGHTADDTGAVAIALKGRAATSDAPAMIYPNQYFAYPEPEFWPGAGRPVQVYDPVRPQDTTMIPVPAVRIDYRGNQALQAAYREQAGGQGALHAVRALVRWPQRRPGQGNQ